VAEQQLGREQEQHLKKDNPLLPVARAVRGEQTNLRPKLRRNLTAQEIERPHPIFLMVSPR